MKTFSFSPPINLSDEGKRLLAVTSFETTNSVFNLTDKKTKFSITIPGHWNSKSVLKKFDELCKLLNFRSQMILNYMLNKSGERCNFNKWRPFIGSLDTFKTEILDVLKNAKYDYLEDMVYRVPLTYDGIIDELHMR